MTVVFMHHDVIDASKAQRSGFCGVGAEVYKVTLAQFREQIAGLAAAFPGKGPALDPGAPFALTFDDGGASATEVVAEVLAARGWKAHFFVVTGVLGMRGFVSVSGLRMLVGQGHTVGTHTVTHPHRLQALPYAHIVREWRDSRERLSDLLGQSVHCGSVPGGYCSRAVRRAAAQAGLSLLLTSEPTVRRYESDGVAVQGRFAVSGRDPAESAVRLAQQAYARGMRALRWQALGVAKNALGPVYPAVREGLLRLRA
ncbi:MAG: polysaccharide deacetylase family protein [Acidiferrobacter sp.]